MLKSVNFYAVCSCGGTMNLKINGSSKVWLNVYSCNKCGREDQASNLVLRKKLPTTPP